MSAYSKIALVLLAAAIVIGIGAIVYLQVVPSPSERFTEFYMLNQDGKAFDYPTQIRAGAPVTVTLGLVNRQGRPASYKIDVVSGAATLQSVDVPQLATGQKWEQQATFSLSSPGDNQTVQFFLYMNGSSTALIKDPLLLRLDVAK